MIKIPLSQQGKHKGKYSTLVDNSDFEFLNKYKWHWLHGYAYSIIKGKPIGLHRFLMGIDKTKEIDHINHNKLDNRRKNLRVVNHQENQMNLLKKKIKTSSKYKGVAWHSMGKKWLASLGFKNKQIYIGLFENERHAGMAYDIWAKEYHKEFAVLNFN